MFSWSQHVFQNTAFFTYRNFLCPFGIICLCIIIIIISTEMISKLSWLLFSLLVICGAVQGSLRSMAYFTFFFSSANVENIYYMLARRYRWQRRYFPFLANIKFVFSNLCVMKTSLKMRWSIHKYNRCNLTSKPLGNVLLAYFEPYYIIK